MSYGYVISENTTNGLFMIFYNNKFKLIRQKKNISITAIAEKIGVNRSTFWSWEKGKTKPNELKIRQLAEIIDVPVTEISDLKAKHPLSDGKISDITYSWHEFSTLDDLTQEAIQKVYLDKLQSMFEKFNQTKVIMKAIMSSIEFMFYVKGTDLKYITVNKPFIQKTSSRLEENQVLGRRDKDFFSLAEAKENEKQDREVILSGKPIIDIEGTIPGTRKKKWGLISKYPIFDSKGKIAGLTGFFIDITERKHNEEIREMLELSLISVSDAYCIREIDKNSYFFVSKAIEKITGIPDEIYKKGGVDFWMNNCVHPDDKEEQNKYYEERSWPDRREYRIIRPDGTVRFIEATCEFQHFLNKDFMCSVIRNITDRKKKEDVKELLGVCLNLSTEGFIITSLKQWDFYFLNKTAVDILGYSEKELYEGGISFWLNNCVHPEDKDIQRRYLKNISIPSERTYRIIRPDGEVRTIYAKFLSKTLTNRQYFISVIKDITSKNLQENK